MEEWLRFVRSVTYACAGVLHTVKTQRNMRIHVMVAIIVLLCTWWLQLPRGDVYLVFFCIGLVISLECMNTAIEAVVDLVTEEFHPKAKIAKDAAAAAVLIAAILSVIIGLLVLGPPLFAKIT